MCTNCVLHVRHYCRKNGEIGKVCQCTHHQNTHSCKSHGIIRILLMYKWKLWICSLFVIDFRQIKMHCKTYFVQYLLTAKWIANIHGAKWCGVTHLFTVQCWDGLVPHSVSGDDLNGLSLLLLWSPGIHLNLTRHHTVKQQNYKIEGTFTHKKECVSSVILFSRLPSSHSQHQFQRLSSVTLRVEPSEQPVPVPRQQQ